MTSRIIAGYVFRKLRDDHWDLISFKKLKKGDVFNRVETKPLFVALEDARDYGWGWGVAYINPLASGWGVAYINPLTSDMDSAKYSILLSADEEKLFRRLAQR